MAKFGTLVPVTPPWDGVISDFPRRVITIKRIEPTKSQYGDAYLLTCDTNTDEGETVNDIVLLAGASVLVDQTRKLLQAMNDTGAKLPVDVWLDKVRGKLFSYWQFFDPDELPD